MERAACPNHPVRPAVARCGLCRRALCADCFRFRLANRPACPRCAHEVIGRPARSVSLAVSFVATSGLLGLWLHRRWDVFSLQGGIVGAGLGLLGLVIGVSLILSRARLDQLPAVTYRDPEEVLDGEELAADGAHPYRARVRRAIAVVAPRLSGGATAAVLAASFLASAVVLPASLRLPRWVEAELVLALWWAIVAGLLGALLHRGYRLRDDFSWVSPWDRPDVPRIGGARPRQSRWGEGGCDGCDGCSAIGDGEGLIVLVVGAVALAVAFGAAIVVADFALPLLFLAFYRGFMAAVTRAAHDRHACEGRVARAVGWGLAWATLYVAPVAVLVALLHHVG